MGCALFEGATVHKLMHVDRVLAGHDVLEGGALAGLVTKAIRSITVPPLGMHLYLSAFCSGLCVISHHGQCIHRDHIPCLEDVRIDELMSARCLVEAARFVVVCCVAVTETRFCGLGVRYSRWQTP